MSKFAAFHDARNMFIAHTSYQSPLTFDEWKAKPDDIKAAILFVQFYNEITLAWSKADSLDFGDDAEGVTTVLQYLEKQVKQTQYFHKDDPSKKATADFRRLHPDDVVAVERRMIEDDPKKFSGAYIYKVAYNCLYCIAGHDRKCDKERMQNEVSPIVTYDGEDLDLLDTIADSKGSVYAQYEKENLEKEFWSVIEDAGLPAEKVMRFLLSRTTDANGEEVYDQSTLKRLNARNKNYECDPLRDVEVTNEAVEEILADLRERFLSLPVSSACGQIISQFATI